MSIRKQTGFTIVELLIVIVVIGILAAITIVSFNGIQNRAEATRTTNAVAAYKKALQLYRLDNDEYPVIGAMCLGDQYPPLAGGIAACRYSTSPIGSTLSAAGRDLLKKYMNGQLPMPSTKPVAISDTSVQFVGAHFYGSSYNYTLDGNPVVTIEYYINGQTCPIGPVYDSSKLPAFKSPAVERSEAIGTVGSRCYILLPQ